MVRGPLEWKLGTYQDKRGDRSWPQLFCSIICDFQIFGSTVPPILSVVPLSLPNNAPSCPQPSVQQLPSLPC